MNESAFGVVHKSLNFGGKMGKFAGKKMRPAQPPKPDNGVPLPQGTSLKSMQKTNFQLKPLDPIKTL